MFRGGTADCKSVGLYLRLVRFQHHQLCRGTPSPVRCGGEWSRGFFVVTIDGKGLRLSVKAKTACVVLLGGSVLITRVIITNRLTARENEPVMGDSQALQSNSQRVGRAAYCGGVLHLCSLKTTVGSNPSPSILLLNNSMAEWLPLKE